MNGKGAQWVAKFEAQASANYSRVFPVRTNGWLDSSFSCFRRKSITFWKVAVTESLNFFCFISGASPVAWKLIITVIVRWPNSSTLSYLCLLRWSLQQMSWCESDQLCTCWCLDISRRCGWRVCHDDVGKPFSVFLACTPTSFAKMQGQPQHNPQHIQALQKMKSEIDAIMRKIVELEGQRDEHRHPLLWPFTYIFFSLVMKAITGLEPTRRCYRMVGGVLVERNVGEVLPVLTVNRDNVRSLPATSWN